MSALTLTDSETATIKNVICDIDGVLMHDNTAVPGANEFLQRILEKGMPLVVLTNYPSQTSLDLANRLLQQELISPTAYFIPRRWPQRISCVVRKGKRPMWWAKVR